jgi:hypothetical protein
MLFYVIASKIVLKIVKNYTKLSDNLIALSRSSGVSTPKLSHIVMAHLILKPFSIHLFVPVIQLFQERFAESCDLF